MTDITALSDNELSKVIAELIEPSDTLPTSFDADQDGVMVDPTYSRLKCWYWVSVYAHGDRIERFAADFCSDPAAILMLYLRLFDEVSTPDLREIKGEDQWITHQRNIYSKMRRRLDFDQSLQHIFGRVNAEIFALSRGWTAKGWEVKHV